MSFFERKYTVRPISHPDARDFFTANHYAKGCGNAPSAIYGLFERIHLIGAIMFQRPGSEATCSQVYGVDHKLCVTGLHRLAILDVTPKNAESWFIGRAFDFLRYYRPDFKATLIYADPSAGHVGGIYQASNARYYGLSKREKRFETPDGGRRSRRLAGVNITDAEAIERGWRIVFDPPKHRYCIPIGRDASELRQLTGHLCLPSLPYPKHDVTANGLLAGCLS